MKPQTMSSRGVHRANGRSRSPARSYSRSKSRSRSKSSEGESSQSGDSSRGRYSDEEVYEKKPNNGFHRPHTNTKEDNANHARLKDLALDVKSAEAKERGDFKHFNLSKDLIEKLKGWPFHLTFPLNSSVLSISYRLAKSIDYLYPIQVATLKHIRAGDDVIAQASTSIQLLLSLTYSKWIINLNVNFKELELEKR